MTYQERIEQWDRELQREFEKRNPAMGSQGSYANVEGMQELIRKVDARGPEAWTRKDVDACLRIIRKARPAKPAPPMLRLEGKWSLADLPGEGWKQALKQLRAGGTVLLNCRKEIRYGRLMSLKNKLHISLATEWDDPTELADTIKSLGGKINPSSDKDVEMLWERAPKHQDGLGAAWDATYSMPKTIARLEAIVNECEDKLLDDDKAAWESLMSDYGAKSTFR